MRGRDEAVEGSHRKMKTLRCGEWEGAKRGDTVGWGRRGREREMKRRRRRGGRRWEGRNREGG